MTQSLFREIPTHVLQSFLTEKENVFFFSLSKWRETCYVNTDKENHGHDSKRLNGPERKKKSHTCTPRGQMIESNGKKRISSSGNVWYCTQTKSY